MSTGKTAREPRTRPELCMQVLYGELESGELTARAATIIGFEEHHNPILYVFRPVGAGTGTQERPKAYSPELAEGCWTYPPFTNQN